jgi:hypothetical protein
LRRTQGPVQRLHPYRSSRAQTDRLREDRNAESGGIRDYRDWTKSMQPGLRRKRERSPSLPGVALTPLNTHRIFIVLQRAEGHCYEMENTRYS